MSALPRLLQADTLADHLDDPGLRILDASVALVRDTDGGPYAVRSRRGAYEREHVPGAAYADLADDFADPDAAFPFGLPTPMRFGARAVQLGVGEGTHVVVYSQDEMMWATRLWWLLRYFGFDDVSVLDGGLPAWRAAGHRVEAGHGPVAPPVRFGARPRPELLATREDVAEVVAGDESGTCLVNALSARVFRGEGPTSYARPGRIPDSVSVPWTGLVNPDTNLFRPLDELDRRLAAAGARGDDAVIAYCGGGIAATVDLFALGLLGDDDARLYDGSLTEWTADPRLPVEVG